MLERDHSCLARRLGYPAEARLLIIAADDLGMCRATNEGCLAALGMGLATTASLMVPCPWARAAAARCPGLDIGVHLTVNCEWADYRWQPLTAAPTLRVADGSLARSCHQIRTYADPAEVAAECRAQIDQALAWGVDVTHLDSHMYTLQDDPALFEIYLDLAVEFALPIRLSGSAARGGDPLRERAAKAGVLAPDHLVALPAMGSRAPLSAALRDLPAGVTEFHAHPALDSPELRSIAGDWPARVDDYELYLRDEAFRDLVRSSGAQLIGYRELRELMRSS